MSQKKNYFYNLKEKDISYCIDSTNEDVRYQRNRIRHRIIPELKAINPIVIDAIVRLGASVREDISLISNFNGYGV